MSVLWPVPARFPTVLRKMPQPQLTIRIFANCFRLEPFTNTASDAYERNQRAEFLPHTSRISTSWGGRHPVSRYNYGAWPNDSHSCMMTMTATAVACRSCRSLIDWKSGALRHTGTMRPRITFVAVSERMAARTLVAQV